MLEDRLDTDLSVINARDEGTGDRDLEQGMNRRARYWDKAAVTIEDGVPLVLVTSASNAALSDVGMVVSRFAIGFLYLE
jgi:hypothetical protein